MLTERESSLLSHYSVPRAAADLFTQALGPAIDVATTVVATVVATIAGQFKSV